METGPFSGVRKRRTLVNGMAAEKSRVGTNQEGARRDPLVAPCSQRAALSSCPHINISGPSDSYCSWLCLPLSLHLCTLPPPFLPSLYLSLTFSLTHTHTHTHTHTQHYSAEFRIQYRLVQNSTWSRTKRTLFQSSLKRCVWGLSASNREC